MTIRCGRCVACRLHKAREWAIRITHEARMHDASCTITCTYAPENLPRYGSLRKRDFQKFMKRLRKAMAPVKLRYFHCGEYGGQRHRPHYHAVIFGTDFPDRVFHSRSPSGFPLYQSDILTSTWQLGHALVGDFSFDAAMYTAKYTTKALLVSKASSEEDYRRWQARYERLNPLTGEIITLEPEYATMSRAPGIGRRFYDEFKGDLYPSDFCIVNGSKVPVPEYYDTLLQEDDPALYEFIKRRRQQERDTSNDSPERLASLETCHLARQSLYSERD